MKGNPNVRKLVVMTMQKDHDHEWWKHTLNMVDCCKITGQVQETSIQMVLESVMDYRLWLPVLGGLTLPMTPGDMFSSPANTISTYYDMWQQMLLIAFALRRRMLLNDGEWQEYHRAVQEAARALQLAPQSLGCLKRIERKDEQPYVNELFATTLCKALYGDDSSLFALLVYGAAGARSGQRIQLITVELSFVHCR